MWRGLVRSFKVHVYKRRERESRQRDIYLSIYLSHGGCRWGANDELKTSRLHLSLSSACLIASPILSPVHSVMLSSHLFLCLPFFLCPLTVPWCTVLTSPLPLVTCPNHFSLRLLIVVSRSSYGPMACFTLFITSSLVMWSL